MSPAPARIEPEVTTIPLTTNEDGTISLTMSVEVFKAVFGVPEDVSYELIHDLTYTPGQPEEVVAVEEPESPLFNKQSDGGLALKPDAAGKAVQKEIDRWQKAQQQTQIEEEGQK